MKAASGNNNNNNNNNTEVAVFVGKNLLRVRGLRGVGLTGYPLLAPKCAAHLLHKPVQARMDALLRVRPIQVDCHRRKCRGAEHLWSFHFANISTFSCQIDGEPSND